MEALLLCPTTSGEPICYNTDHTKLIPSRLLDKIAKDIMVCENKSIRRWDGSIGEYKNHLRKKMFATGGV